MTTPSTADVLAVNLELAEQCFGPSIADGLAAEGRVSARLVDVVYPEVWRVVARKVGRAQGHPVRTSLDPTGGRVSASLCKTGGAGQVRAGGGA